MSAVNIEKPVRLLFLSDHLGYAEGVTHGATTYFLHILPALRNTGIDMHICFLRARHPVADELEVRGVKPVFFNRGKWDPRALLDLMRMIRRYDINLIHAAGMKGILLGRIAGRLTGRRVINHLHDTNDPGCLIRLLHRLTAGWSDACLVISEAVGKWARDNLGVKKEQLRVLYNALDIEAVSNIAPEARMRIRDEFNLREDALLIGIVGRLAEEKGHADFLHAMPALLKTYPDLHLLIIGDGPTQENCRAIIARLGIISSVYFTGHRADVPELLSAIDVLVVPSLQEGLSYSVIECMAVGRPVIACDVGGLPELVKHGETGLLVKAGDGGAFVEGIRRLLDDRRLAERIVDSARVFVRRFSVESHIDALLAVYQQLLSDDHGKGL